MYIVIVTERVELFQFEPELFAPGTSGHSNRCLLQFIACKKCPID